MFGKRLPPVATDEALIEELTSRGVEEIIPSADSLKKLLRSGKRLRIKLGIDPTSPHLHLGRSVPLLKLRDFQRLGHQIVFIIGDATGVVGDTSDKDAEHTLRRSLKF
jgi:tyrosyl-tRNA synthetase